MVRKKRKRVERMKKELQKITGRELRINLETMRMEPAAGENIGKGMTERNELIHYRNK